MTEAASEAGATAQEQQPTETETVTEKPTLEDLQAKLEEVTKESRKWESRAKENGAKATEFDKARKAAMTDAERAVAEAEERGRTVATSEFGQELARTRFDALAGRRNADFDTTNALEFVDLRKFLGDDGRPDDTAIAAAVERLVPAPANGLPSFDGGTRTAPPAQTGMSQLIRKAAGRA